MKDGDLGSVGMVLTGSSITVAGTIIAVMLLGVPVKIAPFLLLMTAVLVVMSITLILFGKQNDANRH